jgi:branched-chain amino acid transport system permease protein
VILSSSAVNPCSKYGLWIILALLGIFPLIAGLAGWGGQVILRTVEVFMLLGLGLNLALGLAGILDLGFAAGFGLGAYSGVLLGRFDMLLAIVVGAALGLLIGFLKGGLASRLRGDYLAVAMLSLGLLTRQLAVNLSTITGGAGGQAGSASMQFLFLNLDQPSSKFYLVFAFVALAAFASLRLISSRTGRAWKAASEDEGAALSSGVDVSRVRLLALALSSALAGLAGALYAGTFSYVDPETLSFHVSSLVLTIAILGGAGNVKGTLLAATAIILYDKLLVPRIAGLIALIWPAGLPIGSAPDIRGASFLNFGMALYLTVWLRGRRSH